MARDMTMPDPTPDDAVLSERAREVLARSIGMPQNLVDGLTHVTISNVIAAMLAFAKEATPPASEAAVPAGEDTVAFVQEWLMSADYDPTKFDRDFAAAIDARVAAAAPKPASERYSDDDEALYARWLAGDEALPTLPREQHLRFQARIDRETKEHAR